VTKCYINVEGEGSVKELQRQRGGGGQGGGVLLEPLQKLPRLRQPDQLDLGLGHTLLFGRENE